MFDLVGLRLNLLVCCCSVLLLGDSCICDGSLMLMPDLLHFRVGDFIIRVFRCFTWLFVLGLLGLLNFALLLVAGLCFALWFCLYFF